MNAALPTSLLLLMPQDLITRTIKLYLFFLYLRFAKWHLRPVVDTERIVTPLLSAVRTYKELIVHNTQIKNRTAIIFNGM